MAPGIDYKSFLTRTDPVVLPYFGGTRVDAADRRFHVEAEVELAPGWWRFQIEGRRAVPVEPATPIDLGSLPAMRGHWCHGWVVVTSRDMIRVALPPDDEPAVLSKVTARRWYSGDWLFDTSDFEDDAEVAARRLLEQRMPLAGVRGVTPSLRTAFGYALGMATAHQLEIAISVRELAPVVVDVADGGPGVVRTLFDDLVEQRRLAIETARRRAEEVVRKGRIDYAIRTATVRERARDPRRRADEALDGAAARMVSCRTLARGTQLDVTYVVDGVRIMTIIDARTLQVIDPGVCLANAHRVLTLDAMPSVIREAIEQDHLNITRHD
ncbi:MAG: hypothetical protein AB7P03_23410 [Kofleriaceae bacterium]